MAPGSPNSIAKIDIIGIKSVLLIDDDEGIRNSIASHLRKLGVDSIDQAEDGSVAWDFLQNSTYDLIITDWKMPKMSGLALANRIRQADSSKNTPILIITGYLNRTDFRLIGEFPLIAALEKPYQLDDLANNIKNLQAESEFYLKENSVVASTFAEFANDPRIFITKLIALLKLAVRPMPLAIKGSRVLQEHNFYEAAESILNIVLTADPECVLALHELGKCYLRQRRYDEAKEILSLANGYCPNNLERLCLLGKANLSSHSYAEAEGNFQEALRVDKGDISAKQGLAVAKVAAEATMEIGPGMLAHSFISAVNARAIANVHSQKYAAALELYQSALQYADDTPTQIKLSFNMGLAFLRWKKPAEALILFKKCALLSQNQFGKAMRNMIALSKKGEINSMQDTSNHDDESIGMRREEAALAEVLANVTSLEEMQQEIVLDWEA